MLSAILLLGLLMLAPSAKQPADLQWSGLGHGKRYLRINEYLFNGVQKVTAIAWQTDTDATDQLPT